MVWLPVLTHCFIPILKSIGGPLTLSVFVSKYTACYVNTLKLSITIQGCDPSSVIFK